MPEYKSDHSTDIVLKISGETQVGDLALPAFKDSLGGETNSQVIGRIDYIRWEDRNDMSILHGYGTNIPIEQRPSNFLGTFRVRIKHINYELFKYALGVIVNEADGTTSLFHDSIEGIDPATFLWNENTSEGKHFLPYTFQIEVINLRKNKKHVLYDITFYRRAFDGNQGDFQNAELEGNFRYARYDINVGT